MSKYCPDDCGYFNHWNTMEASCEKDFGFLLRDGNGYFFRFKDCPLNKLSIPPPKPESKEKNVKVNMSEYCPDDCAYLEYGNQFCIAIGKYLKTNQMNNLKCFISSDCPNKQFIPPPEPEPDEEGAEDTLRDELAVARKEIESLKEKLNKIQKIARD